MIKKISNAIDFCFSFSIKRKEIIIKIKGIIFSIRGERVEIIKIVGKAITVKRIVAAMLPLFVKITAAYPCPFFNNLWPGKMESSVSVSGHPRKIEGIKSTNVWVMLIEVIKTIE